MLLETEGILLSDANRFQFRHIDLKSTYSPRFCADNSLHAKRAFLRQGFRHCKSGFVRFQQHSLHSPRSVANDEKSNFSRRTLIVQPTANFDFLTGVPGQMLDQRHRQGNTSIIRSDLLHPVLVIAEKQGMNGANSIFGPFSTNQAGHADFRCADNLDIDACS